MSENLQHLSFRLPGVAVDIESTPIRRDLSVDKIWCISWKGEELEGSVWWPEGITKERLAFEFANAGTSLALGSTQSKVKLLEIRNILTGEEGVIPIFHSANFDKRVLSQCGVDIPLYHDTQIMAYVVLPPSVLGSKGDEDALRFYSLSSLSRMGLCSAKVEYSNNWNEFSMEMLKYNQGDVGSTFELYNSLKAMMDEHTMSAYIIDMLATDAIINFGGCTVDQTSLDKVYLSKENRLQEVEDRLFQLAPCVGAKVSKRKRKPPETQLVYAKQGVYAASDVHKFVYLGQENKNHNVIEIEPFNPNSNAHVAVVLKALCPTWQAIKRTKKGNVSVDKNVLKDLADEGYEIAALLLEQSKLQKTVSTHLRAFREADQYGKIYPSFLIPGTRTGRLSSRNPNFQNIPKDDCRSLIIAGEGRTLVCCDLSQIELRILGWYMWKFLPNVPGSDYFFRLYEAFADVHASNVTMMGLEGREHSRRLAKIGIFLYIYGGMAKRLSLSLAISMEEAKAIIENLEQNIPALPQLRELMIRYARNYDVCRTIYGRKIVYPELKNGKSNYDVAQAERQYFNAAIQGSQADIIKILMAQCRKPLELYGGANIMQVHDELIFDVPEGNAFSFCNDIMPLFNNRTILPGFRVIGVPGVGKSWADAKADGETREKEFIDALKNGAKYDGFT